MSNRDDLLTLFDPRVFWLFVCMHLLVLCYFPAVSTVCVVMKGEYPQFSLIHFSTIYVIEMIYLYGLIYVFFVFFTYHIYNCIICVFSAEALYDVF